MLVYCADGILALSYTCAWQDQRLIDLPLSVAFCKLVRQDAVSLADLATVDPVLLTSLKQLQRLVAQRDEALANPDGLVEELAKLRNTVEALVC